MLLSDNTICRWICDTSLDTETYLLQKMQKAGTFALQIDESTDVSGCAQLLAIAHLANENCIQ